MEKLRKPLLIVAERSLGVGVIGGAFRKDGAFSVFLCADPQRISAPTLLGAGPAAILVDERVGFDPLISLVAELCAAAPEVPLFILAAERESPRAAEWFAAGATAVISRAIGASPLVTLVRETASGHIAMPARWERPETQPAAAESARPELAARLTPREHEILRLVAAGCTNVEVARRLWVTQQTVKFHLRNVYRKLEVVNRTQASRVAHLCGLVSPSDEAADAVGRERPPLAAAA